MPLRRGGDAQLEGVEQLALLPGDLIRAPGTLQPAPPVTAIPRGMDQLRLAQPLRGPGRGAKQFGGTDRHQPLIEQLHPSPISGKTAVAEQNCTVERLATEIHCVQIHPGTGQLHAVLRIGHMKALQRAQQPTHGQRRRRLQAQRTTLAGHRNAGVFDGAKTDLQLLRQQSPGIGQRQTRAVPLEQLAAEMLFQRLHVPADRTLGDEQALRGLGERAETRRHLEGAQGIERRHARCCDNRIRHD